MTGLPESPGRPLRVGYLHVGRARSGVRRYGCILAAEAARMDRLTVLESDAGERDASVRDLGRAARRLRRADIAHVQWKLADWGPRTGGLPRLLVLLASLRRPVVVTLHDVFERSGVRERWLDPSAIGLRLLGRAARRVVVHSEEERRRLEGLVPADKIVVVPHFVELRGELPERGAARHALGLEGARVATLLGYMTRRRGHRLVIDALALLPDDIVVLFVGSPIEGRDHVGHDLRAHALEMGVAERVRFLGYVEDAELERILAATDVGLCPFRDMSASGALATWISAGRPVVASDLPAIRELEAFEPGSVHRFAPYDPEALALCLKGVMASLDGPEDAAVAKLAERLATPRIVERYLDVYQQAASRSWLGRSGGPRADRSDPST